MPEPKPQRQMREITVLETSGVDHPAHGREGWLVKKSASVGRAAALDRILKGTTMPTTKKDLLEEIAKSKLPEEQKTFLAKSIDLSEDVDAAAKLWQSLRAKSEADDPETPTTTDTTETPAVAAPVVAAAPGLGADVFKSVTDPTEREALAKAAESNPALYKAFEAMEKQAAEALEKAANEESQRLDTEAMAKAAVDYKHLAVDHGELAKALRRVALTHPEQATTITKALTAAEGQVEAADMFKEIGHRDSAPAAGSPMQKAVTIADSLVAAGTVKTRAEGITKAFSDNPALYAEHEAEGTR